MHNDLISAIGNTPLIRMKSIEGSNAVISGKLEFLNPGGSIKDRTALSIIKNALKNGEIKEGDSLIESSSGNMAIALAQLCKYYNLQFIAVVDPMANVTNIKIMEAYGAKVIKVDRPCDVDGWLGARISKVREMVESNDQLYWTNQYSNKANPNAHRQTMAEIASEVDYDLQYLFVSTSTCGTLMGCYEYIVESNLNTKIIAVDAKGSAIFGDKPCKRLIPGHGASKMSALLDESAVFNVIHVSDRDCIIGCQSLLEEQSIFAGGSSGGVYYAAKRFLQVNENARNCALIFCDRGDRYLDTIYHSEWVRKHITESK